MKITCFLKPFLKHPSYLEWHFKMQCLDMGFGWKQYHRLSSCATSCLNYNKKLIYCSENLEYGKCTSQAQAASSVCQFVQQIRKFIHELD